LLKYGYSNFSLYILEYCESDVLIKREQYYIDKLKPHYNICKTAGSTFGKKHSMQTRNKLSMGNKGNKNPMFGKTHSKETRLKISMANKGINSYMYGKVQPYEVRKKIGLAFRNRGGVSIKVYDKSNNFIKEFSTIISVANYFNICYRTIRRYLEKNKSYNGFTFVCKVKDKNK
jgi:group I intron endonuclease